MKHANYISFAAMTLLLNFVLSFRYVILVLAQEERILFNRVSYLIPRFLRRSLLKDTDVYTSCDFQWILLVSIRLYFFIYILTTIHYDTILHHI